MAAFTGALYLSTVFVGGRVAILEGFLPETSNLQPTRMATSEAEQEKIGGMCGAPRFTIGKSLTAPVHTAYFDLKQAQECASEQGLPLLIYFKGHACANCKQMQASTLSDRRVQEILQARYVVAALYTDDKTELPQTEWYTSAFDGKLKKTMGQQNLDYLMTRYKVNSTPFFAIEGGKSNAVLGYTADTEEFLRFLNNGLTR
jgi:thiol:disulfide interchange protein DsbD